MTSTVLRSVLSRVQEADSALRLVVVQMLSSRAVSRVGLSYSGKISADSRVRLILYESSRDCESCYIVVPGLFCSCPYFQTAVIAQGTDWTCKHLLLAKHSDGCSDDISDILSSIYAQFRA